MLVLLFTLSFVAVSFASSHSEAPGTSKAPKSDLTDVYFFKSPTNSDYVTSVVNLDGLRNSQAGPNYGLIDNNHVYQVHFDNNGDATEDYTFQFVFGERMSSSSSPLRINAPYTGDLAAFNANLQAQEYYTVSVMNGEDYISPLDGRMKLSNENGTEFDVPVENAGTKTFAGNYGEYAAAHIQEVNWDGCDQPLTVFVGPRRESFSLPLGKVFDLVNLNPLTPPEDQDASLNSLDRFGVISIVMEIPIACLKKGGQGDDVIGTWASVRKLVHKGAQEQFHFAGEQISRLGNPLVNELLIGLPDKDRWSKSAPADDAQFLSYFTAPSLPVLLNVLFGVEPPTHNRNDLVAILLTGVPTLNFPTNTARKRNVGGKPGEPRVEFEFHNGESTTSTSSSDSGSSSSSSDSDDDDDSQVTYDTYENSVSAKENSLPQVDAAPSVQADVLRLNTATDATPRAEQNSLGFLGGDADGYPNGRRLGDDVVDISLRAVMGAVCHAGLGVCSPSDALSGSLPYTDAVPTSACSFAETFPYLNDPVPGDVTPTDPFPSQFQACA